MIEGLNDRLRRETATPPPEPVGAMSAAEVAHWTTSAEKDGDLSQLQAFEAGDAG